jgi:hypothetical protein
MLWLLVGLACEDRLGFDAVSLYPTFGYVDGCTNVRMGGHGFTDDFSATIGGNPVTDITDPDPDVDPLDQGFEKYGVTPAGEQGFADYKATDSGESVTVTNAFYYLACPGAPYVEHVEALDGTVTISGCGFDAASTSVYLVPKGGDVTKAGKGPFDVSEGCLTASITISPGAGAPPGVYDVYLSLDGGQTFIPDPACKEDTADTATTCPPPPVVTIKGGA